jgi:hypothetical protein
MIRKCYATVKVTLVRQIEFELDDDDPGLDTEGEDEKVEVLECDWAD